MSEVIDMSGGIELYSYLGVKCTARTEEIKDAYKRMASEIGDLKHSERHAEFQTLQKAYETLKDHSKRAIYDIIQRYPTFHAAEIVKDVQSKWERDWYLKNHYYISTPKKQRRNDARELSIEERQIEKEIRRATEETLRQRRELETEIEESKRRTEIHRISAKHRKEFKTHRLNRRNCGR